MKILLASIAILWTLSSCAQEKKEQLTIPSGTSGPKSPHEAVATFGEGCFWHSEIVFQSLIGVRDAVSGYAGGTTTDPGYEQVATGQTGHAEVVQVYYDPEKISYETLVNAFFASQDPTTKDRQGNDEGTEYRSIAFYRDAKEKAILDAAIQSLNQSGQYKAKIVTQVVPFKKFYPAEEYHQEYISHNQDNPYVSGVSIPDFLEFKNSFKGKFK